MLISVIVPVFNSERFLPRCIESIITQSYRDIELLLVDDGSADRSGAICDEYAMTDSRIRVFHKENGGVSSARNLGLAQARGEYIHFVDSDDIVLAGAYQYSAERCFCHFPDFVIFNHLCDADQNQCAISGEELFCNSIHEYVKTKYVRVLVWQKFFKRDYLIKSGTRFDENLIYSEDTDFLWSLLRQDGSLVHSTSILYSYSIVNDGAVRSRDICHIKKTIDSMISVNLHLKKYFTDFSDSNPVKSNFIHKYQVLFNRILCTPYSYKELNTIFAQCSEIGTSHLINRGEIKVYDFLYHHPLFFFLFQNIIRKIYFYRHYIAPDNGDFIDGMITNERQNRS